MAALKRMIELVSPLPAADLLFERVTGRETLGCLFEYEIFALSKKNDLDFDKMLGHHVTLKIELPGGGMRFIDARVAQFGLVGMSGNTYHRYRIVARPWTWILTRTADCRIFQTKSVPDIIKEVFGDHGDVDFDPRLSGSYKPREYCVQYRESDFAFVNRLMEEEGIYTYFEHAEGKHTLVLSDAVSAHKTVGTLNYLPQDKAVREGEEHIRDWKVSREIQSGITVLRDYDFEKPSTDLTVQRAQERPHADSSNEVFDYPGEYIESAIGDHLVRTRLEELQAAHEEIEGEANTRKLACGGLFTLAGFGRKDQNSREYLVVSAFITAVDNSYESGGQDGIEYSVRFNLIPSKEPYRSPRITPRPIVRGPQTAVVVGPAGEEIFCDKYGRVKVQFFWDRLGKNDDKSSCFIRVSQIWAGKQWGWMTIPRIGQEVVVSFLEGNPDNPLITGRVYNAEQMPPWALPANKTQSGILTRSSKGGSPSNANELRFEDKKGSEQVYLHAEKNQDIEVENDETHWVGHDRKKTVDHDENVEVKNNRTEKVGVDEKITIGSNRTEDVGANEKITIGVNRTEKVGANEDITIGANRKENVAAQEEVTIGATRKLTVGASETIMIGASRSETVAAGITQTVGGSVTETVGGSVTQTVAGGITITTPGAYTLTAVGGITLVSPGGIKSVDVQWSKMGGTLIENFGVRNTIWPLNTSISGVKTDYNTVKIDITTLGNKQVGTAMEKVGLKIAKCDGPYMWQSGIKIFKFGMFLVG